MKDKKNKNFMNNNFNNQIWIILGVTIFIYLSFSFFASKPITIDYNRFQKMIKSYDVSKIVVIKNQEIVEITLNEDALLNSNYKDRVTQRRLMRPSYLPDFIKNIKFGNFYPFSDR